MTKPIYDISYGGAEQDDQQRGDQSYEEDVEYVERIEYVTPNGRLINVEYVPAGQFKGLLEEDPLIKEVIDNGQQLAMKPEYVEELLEPELLPEALHILSKPDRLSKKQGTVSKEPLNAYNLFVKDHLQRTREQFTHYTPREILVHLGASWEGLSEDQKMPYQREARNLQQEFNRLYPDFVCAKKLTRKRKSPEPYLKRTLSSTSVSSCASSTCSTSAFQHNAQFDENNQFELESSEEPRIKIRCENCPPSMLQMPNDFDRFLLPKTVTAPLDLAPRKVSNREQSELPIYNPAEFSEPTQNTIPLMISKVAEVRRKRTKKSENHIKRPPCAFSLFSSDRRKTLTKEQMKLNIGKITALLAIEWKECHPEMKQKYAEMAKKLKDECKWKYPETRKKNAKGTASTGSSPSSREQSPPLPEISPREAPAPQASLPGNSPVWPEMDDLNNIFPTVFVSHDYPWKTVIESLGLNPGRFNF